MVWFCPSADVEMVWFRPSADVEMVWFCPSADVEMVWFCSSADVGIVWWSTSADVKDGLVLASLGRRWFSLVFSLGRRKITLHLPSQDNICRVCPYVCRGKNPSADVSNLDLVIVGLQYGEILANWFLVIS